MCGPHDEASLCQHLPISRGISPFRNGYYGIQTALKDASFIPSMTRARRRHHRRRMTLSLVAMCIEAMERSCSRTAGPQQRYVFLCSCASRTRWSAAHAFGKARRCYGHVRQCACGVLTATPDMPAGLGCFRPVEWAVRRAQSYCISSSSARGHRSAAAGVYDGSDAPLGVTCRVLW